MFLLMLVLACELCTIVVLGVVLECQLVQFFSIASSCLVTSSETTVSIQTQTMYMVIG